jgi:DNA-binding response OmpR family regulator
MAERPPTLLFADRDVAWSQALRKRLSERGFSVEAVSTARELLRKVTDLRPDLVVLGDGLDDLGERLLGGLVQERSPETRIVRVLPSGGARSTVEPGPADNVLCAVSRRAPVEDLVGVMTRVLRCAPRGLQATRPPLVVCVDDDVAFLNGLARLIRRKGYRVLTYPDPERALEELPLLRPDLVLLDVLMPGLSGFEFLDELRRYHAVSMPVVLLSGVDGDAQIEEGRRRGAACYLTKPCLPEVLIDTVRRLLESPESASDDRAFGRAGSGGRG